MDIIAAVVSLGNVMYSQANTIASLQEQNPEGRYMDLVGNI
jgi:hypothetical protein